MTWERNTRRVVEALSSLSNGEGYVEGVSFPEIAKAAGVGLRSVPRHLDEAHERGWIVVHRSRGRGLTNRYVIPAVDQDDA